MEACNLDAGGARKRLLLGIAFLAAGLAFSIWHIVSGKPLVVRIPVAFTCFVIASYSLLQARTKT